MPFTLAFGRCPSQSSLGSGRLPCGRHTRNACRQANITRARLHLALSEQSIAGLSDLFAEMVLSITGCPASQVTSPMGPSDAFQCTSTRPTRTTLRLHADRPGLPLPVRLAPCICQPCFMLDRPWAPALQRFLPARRRRRRLPLARMRSRLSSMPFPALRRRGSEDLGRCSRALAGSRSSERMRSPTETLFTPSMGRSSLGRFPPSRMTFRSRPRTSARAPLMGFYRRCAPSIPLRFRASPHLRALFRVSEIRKNRPAHACPPPWGSCLRFPAP